MHDDAMHDRAKARSSPHKDMHDDAMHDRAKARSSTHKELVAIDLAVIRAAYEDGMWVRVKGEE